MLEPTLPTPEALPSAMAQRLRVLFAPTVLRTVMPSWTKGKDQYLLFARQLLAAGFTLQSDPSSPEQHNAHST